MAFDKVIVLFRLTCFKFATVIFAFLMITVIVPVLAVLFGPIILFRIFMSQIAKRCRPDLGKILTAGSTNFSHDKPYEDNPACLSVIPNIFEGTIAVESFRNAFETRVLPFKLPNGQLRYPELKQYPVNWMGFKFWKNDPDFNIQNHITAYKPTPPDSKILPKDLKILQQEALARKFRKKQSCWDILVINNYYPDFEESDLGKNSEPHTVFLFRIHHSMADGYSVMKLMMEGIFDTEIPKDKPKRKFKRPSLGFKLLFPFRGFLQLSKTLLKIVTNPSPLHVPVHKRVGSVVAVSERISLPGLKKFKTELDVSLTSIVLSACAGALRATMTKKGLNVPDEIAAILPFPMPGHPPKLRNHMTQVIIDLPLASTSNSTDRIFLLDKTYRSYAKSPEPWLNDVLAKVMGALFLPLSKMMTSSTVPSVLISNFPADFSTIEFEGHKLPDGWVFCGLENLPSISFFISSFHGAVRAAVVAEKSLMSQDDVEFLVNHLEKELCSYINFGTV